MVGFGEIIHVERDFCDLSAIGQNRPDLWYMGAFFDIMWLRRGPVLAALYPVAMLVVQLALAIAVAYGVASLVYPWVGAFAGLAIVLVRPILALFQRSDGRLFVYYLKHDYAHTAQGRGAYEPAL